jgi:hypothetical protein
MLLSAPEKAPRSAGADVLGATPAETLDARDNRLIADFSGQSLIRLVHVRGRGPTGRLGHKRTETVPLIAGNRGRGH